MCFREACAALPLKGMCGLCGSIRSSHLRRGPQEVVILSYLVIDTGDTIKAAFRVEDELEAALYDVLQAGGLMERVFMRIPGVCLWAVVLAIAGLDDQGEQCIAWALPPADKGSARKNTDAEGAGELRQLDWRSIITT